MSKKLTFGLTSINGGVTSYPETLVRIAQAAEAAGFDSVWADRATAQQFAELGVHRLILTPARAMDAAALEQFIGTVGSTLVGQV